MRLVGVQLCGKISGRDWECRLYLYLMVKIELKVGKYEIKGQYNCITESLKSEPSFFDILGYAFGTGKSVRLVGVQCEEK